MIRFGSNLKWFAALAAVGYAASSAAQGQQNAPPPVGPTVGLSRQVTLSPTEELAQAEGFLSKMDAARSQVRRQLEQARVQRDVVKTLCLNDKLNQLDVAIRSARERRQSLASAVSRSDADLAGHEFTILSVLRQRSDQLTSEANQCIGQDTGFPGDNTVNWSVDPGIPPEVPGEEAPPGAGPVDIPSPGIPVPPPTQISPSK